MREFIQSKLEQINNVDSGIIIPESVIEQGTTYFGYEIQDNYQSEDYNKNYIRRISIIGFVIRKSIPTENTQLIVDTATKDITNTLREINIKTSVQDITMSDNIVKTSITGYVTLNELTNTLF